MTNSEKFHKQIEEAFITGNTCRLKKELVPYVANLCDSGECSVCQQKTKKWLGEEVTELLKPCPFCGNNNVKIMLHSQVEERDYCETNEDYYRDYYTVCCDYLNDGCGACSGYRETEEEAVKLWNNRK